MYLPAIVAIGVVYIELYECRGIQYVYAYLLEPMARGQSSFYSVYVINVPRGERCF